MNEAFHMRRSMHVYGPEWYESRVFWLNGYDATAYNWWRGQAYYTLASLISAIEREYQP